MMRPVWPDAQVWGEMPRSQRVKRSRALLRDALDNEERLRDALDNEESAGTDLGATFSYRVRRALTLATTGLDYDYNNVTKIRENKTYEILVTCTNCGWGPTKDLGSKVSLPALCRVLIPVGTNVRDHFTENIVFDCPQCGCSGTLKRYQ